MNDLNWVGPAARLTDGHDHLSPRSTRTCYHFGAPWRSRTATTSIWQRSNDAIGAADQVRVAPVSSTLRMVVPGWLTRRGPLR